MLYLNFSSISYLALYQQLNVIKSFKVQTLIIFLPKADLEKQFIISGAFELSLHFLPFHFVITVPALSFWSHDPLSVCNKEGDGCHNLHPPVISVEAKGICMHVTNRTGGLGYGFLFKGIINCSRLLRRRKKERSLYSKCKYLPAEEQTQKSAFRI